MDKKDSENKVILEGWVCKELYLRELWMRAYKETFLYKENLKKLIITTIASSN